MTDLDAIVAPLFAGKAQHVLATYEQLLIELRMLGPFQVEPKQTSIHLVRRVGFAGVHPRKAYLYLNLRTDAPIESPRIAKREQVSKSRYHNELRLDQPADVDAELVGWLSAAYQLGG